MPVKYSWGIWVKCVGTLPQSNIKKQSANPVNMFRVPLSIAGFDLETIWNIAISLKFVQDLVALSCFFEQFCELVDIIQKMDSNAENMFIWWRHHVYSADDGKAIVPCLTGSYFQLFNKNCFPRFFVSFITPARSEDMISSRLKNYTAAHIGYTILFCIANKRVRMKHPAFMYRVLYGTERFLQHRFHIMCKGFCCDLHCCDYVYNPVNSRGDGYWCKLTGIKPQ